MQKGRATSSLQTKSGIIHIIVLVVVFILLAALVGGYIFAKRTTVKEENVASGILEVNSNSVTELETESTPTPKSTTTPKSVAKTTVKPTDAPQPTAPDPCEKYKDQSGLVYVKITLIAVGGSTNEPATISVKPIGDCPAGLPTGYTSEITYTAQPGNSVWKSPGFRPGEIRVNIEYKGNGYGYGVEGTIGTHDVNVNLKN